MMNVVIDIIKNVDRILLNLFQSLDANSIIKRSKNNFASVGDADSEYLACTQSKRHSLSEEFSFQKLLQNNLFWIIDSLDATKKKNTVNKRTHPCIAKLISSNFKQEGFHYVK